jgi:glycosyltransferase involved in cell wall biosynthesis
MRTLVVADDYPWPGISGSRLRLDIVLSGLARCGPVDLVSVVPDELTDVGTPSACVTRTEVVRVPIRRFELPGEVRRWSGSQLAGRVRTAAGGDPGRSPWDDYDLVWWSGVRAWVAAGMPGPEGPPAIVDVYDLDDEKILRRPSRPLPGARSPLALRSAATVRRAAARAYARVEVERWRRLYRRCGRAGSVAVVCSDLDASRADGKGFAAVRVVPNGYPSPASPVGRVAIGARPTVVFAATLRYPPNADGARWLVEEVAPRLRARVPDCRVRLVGRYQPAQQALHDPPRVELVGPVDDIVPELAQADVVAVPVRYGSGTRLKVLEAFAHRIPVVSTTLGDEGLDVSDGADVLLADDPGAFAGACERLLGDAGLRHRLVERAEAHFRERFSAELVEQQVAAVAGEVAGKVAGGGARSAGAR